MAGPFFVDDGGDGTTEDSWATADTSINNLQGEYTFASGEIVYFGADSQCQATNSAALTLTGPTSGIPVYFISSTVGSGSTVSYSKGTGNQIDTTESAYNIVFDGSFALYGMKMVAGQHWTLNNDDDELFYAYDCTIVPGSQDQVQVSNSASSSQQFVNCVFDFTRTSSGTTTTCLLLRGNVAILGGSVANITNRTGAFLYGAGAGTEVKISGFDFSAAPSTLELVAGAADYAVVTGSNIKLPASFAGFVAADYTRLGSVFLTNCTVSGSEAPEQLYYKNMLGVCQNGGSGIYRTGGATVEGTATAWLITTGSYVSEGSPFFTPWIYGVIDSTGSKTFTLYISNDTADFTDAETWLEVEYLGTSNDPNTTYGSDHRTITTSAVAQTDDTTSTWNGSGPSFTYKQSLAATGTVNETGQYRARVAVGVASIGSARNFYIDPKVTVS